MHATAVCHRLEAAACPSFHDAENAEGRDEREKADNSRHMRAEEPSLQHDEPEVKRRLVGIRLAFEGECPEGTAAQCFIDYGEIAKFVARREVAEDHYRQECHYIWPPYLQEREKTVARAVGCVWIATHNNII